MYRGLSFLAAQDVRAAPACAPPEGKCEKRRIFKREVYSSVGGSTGPVVGVARCLCPLPCAQIEMSNKDVWYRPRVLRALGAYRCCLSVAVCVSYVPFCS